MNPFFVYMQTWLVDTSDDRDQWKEIEKSLEIIVAESIKICRLIIAANL